LTARLLVSKSFSGINKEVPRVQDHKMPNMRCPIASSLYAAYSFLEYREREMERMFDT
jgi:hypothetical protein